MQDTIDRRVDVYARFLPEFIIDNVAGGKLANQAGAEQLDCAVMFADISGFTALAESFASDGAVGAEKLTATLNTYFSHMVGIIQAHGGDVVKFAGDAVLAIWKDGSTEKELAFASWRAAQCGLKIQEALRGYRAGNIELSLRIAIGAGSVNIVHVGGVLDRWEFLIAGKPLTQVGLVGDDIEPGEVGVSAAAWEFMVKHTGANPVGEEIAQDILQLGQIAHLEPRSNRPPLELTDDQAPLLRAYIPAAVSSRLDANLDTFLGELRRVTILFVNLPDINYQTPVAAAQEVMTALQESCYRYEGSINKLSVDDKGVSLLAALGLPPLAHEDDPDRGVKAALTISQRLKSMGVRCSIGVSSGRVYCGVVGSEVRREYTLMGDNVNLSARLMQSAKGRILCDQASFSRSSSDIDFSDPFQISLKGKAKLQTVFEPIGFSKRQRDSSNSPMIGRKLERAELINRFELLLDGKPGVVFIEADAGYGKSRLTQDFVETITHQPVSLLLAAADAIERHTPYFAIRELLNQVLGFTSHTSVQDAHGKIEALLQEPELIELLPLLDSIIPMGLTESEFTSQISGEARAKQTARLVSRLISSSRVHEASVLVIEDVHWLDDASWSLLSEIHREVQPTLMILVTRPIGEPNKDMRYLFALPETVRIKMDRMPEADILTLVCARLGVTSIPESIGKLILSRADGHPYFSEEMAFALRDSQVIEVHDGQCELAARHRNSSLQNLDIPESIEGIITSRIDRLSAEQAMTIKVASVIGRTFSLSLLHDLHPVKQDRSVLEDELRECGRLHLTPQDTEGDDPTYIFKHMITQEVSHSLLLNDQSKQLHKKLAQAYETDERSPPSLLAHHWQLAEHPEEALRYYTLAVDQALEEFANNDVIELTTHALNIVSKYGSSPLTHGHLLRCRGQALFDLGHLPDALAVLKQAVATLGVPLGNHPIVLTARVLQQVFLQYYYAQKRRQHGATKTIEPTIKQQALDEASQAYSQIQVIYYFMSDNLRTVLTALRGANLGDAAGTVPNSMIRSNANLGVVAGLLPIRKVANYFLELADQQIGFATDSRTIAWVELVKATYTNGLALWDEAEAHYQKSYDIANTHGDESHLTTLITGWSKFHIMAGRYQDALNGFESLYPIAIRRDDPQAICWSVLGQARCYLRTDRLKDISPFLDEAAPLLDRLPFNQRMDHLSLSALKHLHDDQLYEAERSINACTKLLSRPSQVMMIFASTQIALAILEYKRRCPEKDIRSWWRRANSFSKSYATIFPLGKPGHLYQCGLYQELLGNNEKAKSLWMAALQASIEVNTPYTLTHCYRKLEQYQPDICRDYQQEYQRALQVMTINEPSDNSLLAEPS